MEQQDDGISTTEAMSELDQSGAPPDEEGRALLSRTGVPSTSFDVEAEQVAAKLERPYSHMVSNFRGECWQLGVLAGPLVLQQLVIFSTTVISVVFVGRLGQFELGVIILSNSIFTGTGQVTMMGVASVMETLCGQAFGSGNFNVLGVILQRALLLCGLGTCGILVIWSQLEPILLAIGQDPAIAAAAASYTLATTPSLMLVGITECGKRYLMAQNIVAPMAIVFTLGAMTAPLYNWLFIYKLNFGITGAAIALAAVNASNTAMLVCYIVWHNRRLAGTKQAPWTGWSMSAFKNWPQYIRIAIPSLLMLCLEWWLFEAMILSAGLLDNPQLNLSAMGVLLNVIATIYTFPYGLSGAASTRVANALGAGDHRAAVNTAAVSLIVVVIGQVLLGVVMVLGRNHWGYVFTSELPVISLAASTFPVVAMTCMGDGANAVLAGVIRGCGRQTRAAIMNAVTYWCLGLPLSLALAFKLRLGVFGLWSGLMTAASIQAVAISLMVFRLDWREEARRAADVVHEEAVAVLLADVSVADPKVEDLEVGDLEVGDSEEGPVCVDTRQSHELPGAELQGDLQIGRDRIG